MKIENIRNKIIENAKKQDLEIVPHSSVISWLYPGQFSYCLNENFIWDKYGTMIDIPCELHFHKIQPSIRWNDFIEYIQGSNKNSAKNENLHLANFDMATITGGHIMPKENYTNYSKNAFEGMINLLVDKIGLKKENFEVTYFPGLRLSEFGLQKNGNPKFNFDHKFSEDTEAKENFKSLGLKEGQIKPDASRNCFLMPDWVCGETVPWGYRNEINYLHNGSLVDIATIERLLWRPLYEDNEIIGLEEWDKSMVISGAGLERLAMVTENLNDIYCVGNIEPLFDYISVKGYENPKLVCESLRMLHRIVSDSNGEMRDPKSTKNARDRKSKYNNLLRNLSNINEIDMHRMLEINSDINPWYSELRNSSNRVIEQLKKYGKIQKYGGR